MAKGPNMIPDPGNGRIIATSRFNQYVEVFGGSTSRTVAPPIAVGQRLTITQGATAETNIALNITGGFFGNVFTVCTFNATGGYLVIESVPKQNGPGFIWLIIANGGTAFT
jgi:hypothetical protein